MFAPEPKYYLGIKRAQAETRSQPQDALPPFNLDQLGADSPRRRLRLWLIDLLLPPILFLLREFWPIAKIGKFVIITRESDIRDVLARTEVFEVPFCREMTELAGGENFVLGLEGKPHALQDDLIRSVMGDQRSKLVGTSQPLETPLLNNDDILKVVLARQDVDLVRGLSNHFANVLMRNSGGRIDVMSDYITRVATETCVRYFGLTIDDPDAFAEWSMSISALLFADPFGDAATRELALNGATRIRNVIDVSIAQQRKAPTDSVLGRLINLQNRGNTVSDANIRAILVGMIAGFIPTNSLAAGKIFQELKRRPEAMRLAIEKARRAVAIDKAASNGSAKAGNSDKDALQTILYEAVRLNPPLTPGQWRYAKEQASIGTDSWRRKSIAKDSVLMVATMSALRDRRAVESPGQFCPDRERVWADLAFGTGTHECLGKYLAMAQITEIFVVLLAQTNLRFSEDTWGSRIRWVGPFPRRLDMTFDPETGPAIQTMITICAPLLVGRHEAVVEKVENIQREIAALGNPAGNAMQQMLDGTGIVHFASLSVAEAGDAREPAPHLLLELNVDGSGEAAIQSIARADAAAGGKLHSIFRNTPKGNVGLAEVLGTYVLDLQTRPWSSIGLSFNGTPEFSVADIAMQEVMSKVAKLALNYYMRLHSGIGNRAMQALRFVRMFMHHPERSKAALLDSAWPEDEELRDAADEATKLKDFLIVPSRRRLKISDWKESSWDEAVSRFLKSWAYWRLAIFVIAVAVLFGITIFCTTATGATTSFDLMGRIILAVIGGPAAALALLALLVVAALALLRHYESQDVPDDQNPKLEDIRRIASVEDAPGFAQNHFMAVTALKAGWFRKLTLALSLWGIKQMVLFYFRPGFVLNMGTIHYAKWFRIPGHDKMVFQANYDGSWESYLEDFIMKAHEGQTAAWCNGVGFPRTKYLIYEGAQDGDRFKRWVRRQQVVAHFWYSRFPHLTTDQIRNNALIHDGLARASTDSAARAWLDCFGSIPRPDYAIETDEVQSLVFRGQRLLPYATCAVIRLPGTKQARLRWLEKLDSGSARSHERGGKEPPKGDKYCAITFGDHPYSPDPEMRNLATFVAFSAAGLHKLGLSGPDKRDGLGTFPNTFNLGMANRGRSLGDLGEASSTNWRWADADDVPGADDNGQRPPAVDAILLIYANDPKDCKKVLDEHILALGNGALVHEIPIMPPSERLSYDETGCAFMKPLPPGDDPDDKNLDIDHEHFGFRDGISQPVIRGTQRFAKGARKRDIVEPGEFILGYRNNQGYYPPTATVRAESDVKAHLPTVLADIPSRFPSFGGGNTAARDFGRNGSFLVVRQLAQNVSGFMDFLEHTAKTLKDEYEGLPNAVGSPITAEWLAAKIMGRWPDGTPLVERPGAGREEHAHGHQQESNNFNFGTDDPQGLHCPFGAHIRRANPRDSMQPDDPSQQSITNRHRLLRRGRPYEYKPEENGKMEKGLLFTCLCSDLDRQYEFVQQTWIQSPSFHGLRNEPDPMVAWSDPGASRIFTIPTPSGPVTVRDMKSFVTVRAGGYFFLPSRSAIQYLEDINRSEYTPLT